MTGRLILGLAVLLMASAARAAEVKCVAHRGNNVAEFENSWASIRSAAALGSQGIEFDVVHTRDGVGILLHDKTLERLAEGDGCVLDVPVAEQSSEAILGACRLRNGEPIPVLADVLQEAEEWDAALFVELKDVPSDATVALLEKHRSSMGDRLRVISFDKDALQAVAPIDELSAYKLAVGLVFRRVRRFVSNPWAGYDLMLVRKRRVRRIREAGGEVAVWTVDDPKKIRRMVDRGVSWITTNDPATCMREVGG